MSRVSEENRAVTVNSIGRKFKVGGILYISCNPLPDWAAFAPMRHLMTEHAETIGADGQGITARIDKALEFIKALLAANPLFAAQNPNVAPRLTHRTSKGRTGPTSLMNSSIMPGSRCIFAHDRWPIEEDYKVMKRITRS